MKFTKNEIKSINEYERNEFNPELLGSIKDARGKKLDYIIVVSHGRRDMHDSGYPYIKILGRNEAGFFNLGWHDHFLCQVPVNIDSLGKNVYRVMPWSSKTPWVVSHSFISVSTFEIGKPSYYPTHDPNVVELS